MNILNRAVRLYFTMQHSAQAYFDRALAIAHVSVALPVHYPHGCTIGPLTANDPVPNTTEPAAARVILGSPTNSASVSHIAIWPATITAACVIDVWVRSEISKPGSDPATPLWVRVKSISFANNATDVEVQVPVGFRDSFVQVVSGAGVGTPVTLAVAAC